ncbi:MAG: sulfite exporter TauE/SafE family protein [candidate division Zixibacteria bacterium]|nr:sulfite exporter TauE/SafE family protein [candidate division Zixibacteria bacterium]
MNFPISGVDTPLWLPPLVGFCFSFFASMGGLSGAFVLLPFQVSVLGYTSPSVSATNHVFNVVAIPSGVYRFVREQRMVWPLTWAVVIGTLPGVFIGAWIRVSYLPDPTHFKVFVGCVLLYIGFRLLMDTIRGGTQKAKGPAGGFTVTEPHFSLRRVGFTFEGQRYDFATPGIMVLCFVVGIIGGIYGIGGGAIIVPFFVAFYRMPVYTVSGAALMGTFVTSLAGVVFYQILGGLNPDMEARPDWLLGGLFGAGGLCGMYLGARSQRFVPARVIKAGLSAALLFVAVRYISGLFF